MVIIGNGPAGLTAAIYASRADLSTLVLTGAQPGGQLTITTDVENFPGFPDGIMGPELMEATNKQAARFGAEITHGEVTSISASKTPFELTVDDNHTISADTVIVASGAKARLLGLESETHLMGYGVSACATCDGFFFRDKEIAIIGGGDSAMEEATFLTKFASRVTVIHRRETLRASKYMQEKAKSNPKIHWIFNSTVKEIIGTREEGVSALILENKVTGEESRFPCQGIFMAIGHTPNTDFLGNQLDTDEGGYLIVSPGTTQTSVQGIFAAGDVADKKYRQAVTAAGTGCMAALDAEHYLEHLNG